MSSIEQSFNFYQSGTTPGTMFLQIEPGGNLLNSYMAFGTGEDQHITGTYDQVTHAVNFHIGGPGSPGGVLHETSYSGYVMFDPFGNLSALAGEYHRNGIVLPPGTPAQGAWYATAFTVV
jgi:hypothetical protein